MILLCIKDITFESEGKTIVAKKGEVYMTPDGEGGRALGKYPKNFKLHERM